MKKRIWIRSVGAAVLFILQVPQRLAGFEPPPAEASSLILERVRIRTNTAIRPGRQNGNVKIDGTLNANAPFQGFVADVQLNGLTARITGAGSVDVLLSWGASDCTIRNISRGPLVSCTVRAGREKWQADFRPRPIPNLFDVKLRAKRLDIPPMSSEEVTVQLSTSSLDPQDDIGNCVLFGRWEHRLRCRESGVVPTPTYTPTPTVTPTPTFDPAIPLCGDGALGAGEQCDDGGVCVGGPNASSTCFAAVECPGGVCKPVGGDGCAFNCTPERLRSTNLHSFSRANVQQATFAINIPLDATLNLRTGIPRSQDTLGPQMNLIAPAGTYPVTIREGDITFERMGVTGLVCACPRLVEIPLFGAGNAGEGLIGCGAQSLSNVSYRIVQDHNTTPGHSSNGNTPPQIGLQLPDDPECDDTFSFPSGLTSGACLEGQDPPCDDPDARGQHPGVCNSPRVAAYFGGEEPRGSALIHTGVAIGLLNDAGLCRTDLSPGDFRCPADYGPDCQPCTADDADLGAVEMIALTTGTAAASVYDAAFQKGRTIDVVAPPVPCFTTADCAAGQRCLRQCEVSGSPCPNGNECGAGDTCGSPGCSWNGCGSGSFLSRCNTTEEGTAFNCAALAADQSPGDGDGDGLSDGTFAVSYPNIDSLRVGDNVTTMRMVLE